MLVPVGHDLGVFHDGAGSPPVHQVRVGAELVELSVAEYEEWTAASSPALESRGLLASTDDPIAFASAHRLLPLALGLGNTVEEPWLFSAGLLYQPLVAMTGPLYDLWQWAHLSPDLWSACQEAAAVAVAAGVTTTEQTEPAEVLAGALETAPHLLASRVACFDVRTEGV
ncbi:hypothetical protein [Actinophytocola oryzae]|uniref:Uncharacterized protein n=1 Tax=Actinophytocola oryzae TaxID=502181 RepID=A0A4R7UTT0_9PSEU|nr:hypothetical protein [Actinophytocola oryzae]TDV40078.1 hypothetical protein CLV71_12495 [Actinophytocola oryzae]